MVHHEAKRVTRHLHCRHPRPQNQLPPLPLRQQTLLQRCGLRQGAILGNPSMLAVTPEQFNMTSPILEHYYHFFEVQPGFMNSIGQPFRRSRQLIMRHSRVQNAVFVELQATGNCRKWWGIHNTCFIRKCTIHPKWVIPEMPRIPPTGCSCRISKEATTVLFDWGIQIPIVNCVVVCPVSMSPLCTPR